MGIDTDVYYLNKKYFEVEYERFTTHTQMGQPSEPLARLVPINEEI